MLVLFVLYFIYDKQTPKKPIQIRVNRLSIKSEEYLEYKNHSWIVVRLVLPIFNFLTVTCEMLKYSKIQALKWRLVLL